MPGAEISKLDMAYVLRDTQHMEPGAVVSEVSEFHQQVWGQSSEVPSLVAQHNHKSSLLCASLQALTCKPTHLSNTRGTSRCSGHSSMHMTQSPRYMETHRYTHTHTHTHTQVLLGASRHSHVSAYTHAHR
jgi:hypothetical protein